MSKEPNDIKEEIINLKFDFERVSNQKRLLEKAISEREAMELDVSEYSSKLKDVIKIYDKLKIDIPAKEKELSDLEKAIAAARKKKALIEFIENRLEYYGEALKLVNGKKGKRVHKVSPSSFEGDIAQYMRVKGE